MEPRCPKDSTHQGYTIYLKASGPHYASLCCKMCDQFIKWITQPQAAILRAQQQVNIVQDQVSDLLCPLLTDAEKCRKLMCAWWVKNSDPKYSRCAVLDLGVK